METADGANLRRFVLDRVQPGSTLYTDEAAAYRGVAEFEYKAWTKAEAWVSVYDGYRPSQGATHPQLAAPD